MTVASRYLRARQGPGLRRSVVMSASSVAPDRDAEGGEGSAWVASVAAQRGGDVDQARPAQHADDQVAQGRHDIGSGAGAELGGVLGEGGVAKVVSWRWCSASITQCPRSGSASRAGPARAAVRRLDPSGHPTVRRYRPPGASGEDPSVDR
jgi:hypothetical protein